MTEITTFIAYDFSIASGFTDTLDLVSRKPKQQGHIVNWPGSPEGKAQGSIWRTIVSPAIEQSDRLIAYADLANANVGFEVGYALGLGKPVALARVRTDLPTWLSRPPFNGFLVEQAETPSSLRKIIHRDDEGWVSPPDQPATGEDILFLCPPKTGEAYTEEAPEHWRKLEKEGWELDDLTHILTGVRDVVWIIAPHYEPDGRDGDENAALSVIAGYVSACDEMNLHVFAHKDARTVADVLSQKTLFNSGRQLTEQLKKLEAEINQPAEPETPPATIEFERPEVGVLPEILNINIIEERFIGRELQMGDVEGALTGLVERFNGREASGGAAVQLMWYYGFGGMGKSWFLRHAAIRAKQTIATLQYAIIDWDSNHLRAPLTRAPLVPVDLFDPIAHRLAQLTSVHQLDPYWLAKRRIAINAEAHQTLRHRFDTQLNTVARGDNPDPDLRQLLNERGQWHADKEQRKKVADEVQSDTTRFETLFEAWCNRGNKAGMGDVDSMIKPNAVLLQGLQTSIREISKQQPLLLLFDTCEMLNQTMIGWLRHLVAPLCDGQLSVLVLIGSRLAPDVEVPLGRREGWRAEIDGQRFRPIPFDEQVYFTIENVSESLKRLKQPVPELEALPERLHQVTRGIPLALRVILDLHDEGDPVLQTLGDFDSQVDSLNEIDIVQKIIEVVTNRMLLHLERRPEAAEDLKNIVALALLTNADREILTHFWRTTDVLGRLRDLSTRYSLLANGDLHAIVRQFLRAHWRLHPRPACFESTLTQLADIVTNLALPNEDDPHQRLSQQLRHLNILGWQQREKALALFPPAIALATAYDFHPFEFIKLSSEISSLNQLSKTLQYRFPQSLSEDNIFNEYILSDWLESIEKNVNWSPESKYAFMLIKGITKVNSHTNTNLIKAYELLNRAQKFFIETNCEHYLSSKVGESWFELANQFLNKLESDLNILSITIKVYEKCIEYDFYSSGAWNNLGIIQYNYLKNPKLAESSFQKSVNLDPNNSYPWNWLGNLYSNELDNYEESEKSYKQAIQIHPLYSQPWNGLGALHKKQNRYVESEEAFKTAINLDPTFAAPWHNLGHLYHTSLYKFPSAVVAYKKSIEIDPTFAPSWNNLANLYKNHFKQFEEAESAYHKAIELDPHDPVPKNNLAWLYYERKEKLEKGTVFAREAIALAPKNPYFLHTYLSVEIHASGWTNSYPGPLLQYLQLYQAGFQEDAQTLFAEIIHKKESSNLLSSLKLAGAEDKQWLSWVEAIDAINQNRPPSQNWQYPESASIYNGIKQALAKL